MKVDPEAVGFDPGRLERITEHFEDRWRKALMKFVEIVGGAGPHKLFDHHANRLSDPRELEMLAGGDEVGQWGGVLDRGGGLLVGHVLIERLAGHFHEHANLEELRRNFGIGEHG